MEEKVRGWVKCQGVGDGEGVFLEEQVRGADREWRRRWETKN